MYANHFRVQYNARAKNQTLHICCIKRPTQSARLVQNEVLPDCRTLTVTAGSVSNLFTFTHTSYAELLLSGSKSKLHSLWYHFFTTRRYYNLSDFLMDSKCTSNPNVSTNNCINFLLPYSKTCVMLYAHLDKFAFHLLL